MKHPLLSVLLLAATWPAVAQTAPTLTAATFPAGPGTVERYQDAGPAAAPSLGAGQVWDYRALVASGTPYANADLAVPANPPFTGAQWTQVRGTGVGSLYVTYATYLQFGPGGVLALGRAVPRQAFALQARTAGATDSLVVDRQTARYGSAGVVEFPLPLTTGGVATRRFRVATTGSLTVQALGLNKAPLRLVQRYFFADSVAGSGTVRVPVAGQSAGSPALAVLLLRSRTVRQDSFLLNGSPAPAALLAGLGVMQGQVTTYYYDQFWRTGSAQPVLELDYPSAQYGSASSTTYSAETTLLAADPARALPELVIYPNPVPAGSVPLLSAGNNAQSLRVTVYSLLGQVLRQGASTSGQPMAPLAGLPAGSYVLELRTDDGQCATRRVQVQ